MRQLGAQRREAPHEKREILINNKPIEAAQGKISTNPFPYSLVINHLNRSIRSNFRS